MSKALISKMRRLPRDCDFASPLANSRIDARRESECRGESEIQKGLPSWNRRGCCAKGAAGVVPQPPCRVLGPARTRIAYAAEVERDPGPRANPANNRRPFLLRRMRRRRLLRRQCPSRHRQRWRLSGRRQLRYRHIRLLRLEIDDLHPTRRDAKNLLRPHVPHDHAAGPDPNSRVILIQERNTTRSTRNRKNLEPANMNHKRFPRDPKSQIPRCEHRLNLFRPSAETRPGIGKQL